MFTDGRMAGRTMDGCQAHRYIPRTFPSGDKKCDKLLHCSSHFFGKMCFGVQLLKI